MTDAVLWLYVLLVILRYPQTLCDDWRSLQWSVSDNEMLPREDCNMAVAYHNDTIFLFGGWFSQSQAITFDLPSHTMTDIGNDYLPFNLSGNSKYYEQINHLFYAIDPVSDPTNIIIYNLITQHVSNTKPMSQNVGEDGCLSSTHDLLFVVGGRSNNEITESAQPLSTTQIYNISSQRWTMGASMHTARIYHSCIVDPIGSKLYVIGGIAIRNYTNQVIDSIEKLSIHHAMGDTSIWKYTESLSPGVSSASAIMIESTHEIYVFFGAIGWTDYRYVSGPQVINCESGSVTSLSFYPSDVAVYAAAAISAHNTIYAFGGLVCCTSVVRNWSFMHLFPTNAPTSIPTVAPTYVSIEVSSNSFQNETKSKRPWIAIVVIGFIICPCSVVGCIIYKKNGERKWIAECGEPIDIGYIQLPEGGSEEGQRRETKGRIASVSDINNDGNEDEDEDDIYSYAPPLDVLTHGEDEGIVSGKHAATTSTTPGDDRYTDQVATPENQS